MHILWKQEVYTIHMPVGSRLVSSCSTRELWWDGGSRVAFLSQQESVQKKKTAKLKHPLSSCKMD